MDIHTDEGSDELWESVCDYLAKELPAYFQGKNRELIRRPEKLKELYEKLDKEERKALGARLGTNYPEIRIECVWERILGDSISQPIAASIPITHYSFEDDNIVPGRQHNFVVLRHHLDIARTTHSHHNGQSCHDGRRNMG